MFETMKLQTNGGAIPALQLRHRLRLARDHAGMEQVQLHRATNDPPALGDDGGGPLVAPLVFYSAA